MDDANFLAREHGTRPNGQGTAPDGAMAPVLRLIQRGANGPTGIRPAIWERLFVLCTGCGGAYTGVVYVPRTAVEFMHLSKLTSCTAGGFLALMSLGIAQTFVRTVRTQRAGVRDAGFLTKVLNSSDLSSHSATVALRTSLGIKYILLLVLVTLVSSNILTLAMVILAEVETNGATLWLISTSIGVLLQQVGNWMGYLWLCGMLGATTSTSEILVARTQRLTQQVKHAANPDEMRAGTLESSFFE